MISMIYDIFDSIQLSLLFSFFMSYNADDESPDRSPHLLS